MWDEPSLPPALPSSPRSPTTAMAEIDAAKQWESDWNEVEVAAAVADQIASEEHALAMASRHGPCGRRKMQSRRRPAGHKKGIKSPDLMIRQSTIETKLVLPWRSS